MPFSPSACSCAPLIRSHLQSLGASMLKGENTKHDAPPGGRCNTDTKMVEVDEFLGAWSVGGLRVASTTPMLPPPTCYYIGILYIPTPDEIYVSAISTVLI
ncbi:hypothetical protein K438DRAFT_1766944 [Mycena galopus ATCC 62051]|nr:hypothetical protein K438DRAFT_1766944 [Mycena galopus ATCC 62051]